MNRLLRCIGAPQSPSALLGPDLRPSISFCITISTPLDRLTRHQALLLSWWRTSFPTEFIILPFKLHFDSPQANLNSNPLRYHKSSKTTLEFNFTHSPGANHSEIQGVPPASLRHVWIVCSSVCWPWWDGRFVGWHWEYIRLRYYSDRLVGLLFWFYLLSFLNHSPFSLDLP